MSGSDRLAEIKSALGSAGVTDLDIDVRQFESEKIYLLSVNPDDLQIAMSLAPSLETALAEIDQSVVVSVRPRSVVQEVARGAVKSLQDSRVDILIQLLTSRSRTSEAQPSLSYIPNNTANIASVTGARHHLIFGRRGAGKTALMLEAKRIVEEQHHATAWINLQPLRSEGIERTVLHIAQAMLQALLTIAHSRNLVHGDFFQQLTGAESEVAALLDQPQTTARSVRRAIPDLQRVIKRASQSLGVRLYVFVDDFYYVPRPQQADVLDLLHAITRDSDVWLKVASIRHLTRWFRPSPPTGLQTGQDADLIDLDLSLQDTSAAIAFLERMFLEYCRHAGIATISNVMNRDALERLVFASGGVPRDFLTLAASATSKARTRASARQVGVTEINQAAGDAARSKLGELEDDLVANIGYSKQTFQALTRVREFCLDDKSFTYFRVDFRDKDRNADAYAILTRLLEVRMVHLIDASVSDGIRAGERAECYTLDLSQYSGMRLKQKLRVLDLKDGHLISKQTRVHGPVLEGKTARQVLSILRGAPLLELTTLRDLVDLFQPAIDDIEHLLGGQRGSLTLDEIAIAVGRPYHEVADELSTLVERQRVLEIDADGSIAYRLAKRS